MNKLPEGHKVNLGCGAAWEEGWRNVDGGPATRLHWLRRLRVFDWLLPRSTLLYPPDLLRVDLRHPPLPFADSSAAVVFSSYVIEYLTETEGANLLADCYRILRSGGLIRLIQVDVGMCIEEYLGRRTAGVDAVSNVRLLHKSVAPDHTLLGVRLFRRGGIQRLFDRPSIEFCLRQAGFDEVRFCDRADSACPDLGKIEGPLHEDRPMLRVEALKP